jgi:hypothetical protein
MRTVFNYIYKYALLVFFCFGFFIIFRDCANLKLITADSSIYLSTAENIADHKGFVVSYNLCQCFNTLYHPIWPYYQPLYSIFASFFINHGGMVQVIKANILLFEFNLLLILYILQRLVPTSFNIIFISFLAFSLNVYLSVFYAWTEHLHFFCFILTFILFLKFKDRPKHLLWLGGLNAIIMLIKVAHLYNFLAYFPVIFIGKDSFRQKFNRAFCFAGGFILAYGLYQLFCLSSYHTFYPEYARSGASYGMSRFYSGIAYDPNKVGLQIPLGSIFTSQHLLCVGRHLLDFYKRMPLFLWPALFYYFIPVKKRAAGGLIELCFSQSIFTIVGYSLTFYWLTDSFESLRYSLIPYVLISVVGWYCIYQGLSLSESMAKKFVGLLVLTGLFLFPQINKFMVERDATFKEPWLSDIYYKDLFASYRWIDKNIPKEALVASNDVQDAYFMHRPFISTPLGRSYNCTNLALYNHIYSPDYYLLTSLRTDECFRSIAHSTIFSNETFRILKIEKNKK